MQVEQVETDKYEGCIVIHTEHLDDYKVAEIAEAIAAFLTREYPDYAEKILS